MTNEISTSLDVLGLRTKTYNALRRSGVDSVEKLLSCSDESLRELRHIGDKAIKEIHKSLSEYDDLMPREDFIKNRKPAEFGSPLPIDIHEEDPKSYQDIVTQQLDVLTRNERKVLEQRFGISDGLEHTLAEIGAELGVTRERIRQIESRGLRKLRQSGRARLFRKILEAQPIILREDLLAYYKLALAVFNEYKIIFNQPTSVIALSNGYVGIVSNILNSLENDLQSSLQPLPLHNLCERILTFSGQNKIDLRTLDEFIQKVVELPSSRIAYSDKKVSLRHWADRPSPTSKEEGWQIQTIKSHYRSGQDNLATDFFTPCLLHCSSYKRAVGYFSSSALITWSSALPKIVVGKKESIQLLISPKLSGEDQDAIRKALSSEARQEIQQNIADRIVLEALHFAKDPTNMDLRRKILTWLVSNEILELRFAFAKHVESPGIFHEKIGVFKFPSGETVAFTGSANESQFGHSINYESLDAFRSWVPEDVSRVKIKEGQFDEAWTGAAIGLEIALLSVETLRRIKKISPDEFPTEEQIPPEQPKELGKWRHQDEALDVFLSEERGILEMATGTGKTRTALKIIERLVAQNNISSAIVSTKGTDLLDQWYGQLTKLALILDPSFSVLRHYQSKYETERFILDPRNKILLVRRSALSHALKRIDTTIGTRTLLIHDEVHGLGSPGNREALKGLSEHIRYRLGLSATPEREYDDQGNQFISDHIGQVIYEFTLKDAIHRGILCPFDYFPLEYELDDRDKERIQNVYAKVAARKKAGEPMTKEEIWIEIARVHKTSYAKLPLFDDFISIHQEFLRRCIIFVETREYGDKVLSIVHKHRPDFHTYYAAEDSDVLHRFAKGELECLITCHRLSEGIDIQNLETVILFSSSRARLETIQRMGRCLRVNPDDPDKRAQVIDFIRQQDPESDFENADQLRKDWLVDISATEPERWI